MRTTHRNYDEGQGDFNRLARFFQGNDAQVRGCSTWCIGRFVDWKYGLYENKTAVPDFCGSNAHLWFDGFGRLAGFAISENGGPEITILTLAGYRFLFEEMLLWCLDAWGHRGPLSIEITARQKLETAVLQQHGFHQAGIFYRQTFDLTHPLAGRLPLEEGFTIVDMAAHPDYRAQRILRMDAFQGLSDPSEEQIQQQLLFYNHSQRGPIYHAPTDLCVMAPDGRFVAGCEALIDAHNASADIERVCTHSAFRRRGFARAVILECLYRLQSIGLQRAYIAGYSEAAVALYASLGSVGQSTFYIYELSAPQPG
jgi:GNAT superfamily N-acetyltransferase